MLGRRQFIRNAALGAGAILITRCSPFSSAAATAAVGASIDLLLEEPLGTISPNIYGHFTED
jgi:alpha-L-arabinofuranosidase